MSRPEFQPNGPSDLEKRQSLSCLCCGLDSKIKKISDVGGCIDLQELTIENKDLSNEHTQQNFLFSKKYFLFLPIID